MLTIEELEPRTAPARLVLSGNTLQIFGTPRRDAVLIEAPPPGSDFGTVLIRAIPHRPLLVNVDRIIIRMRGAVDLVWIDLDVDPAVHIKAFGGARPDQLVGRCQDVLVGGPGRDFIHHGTT